MAAYGAEINRFGPGGVIFAVTSADGDAPSLSQLLRAPGMVRDLSFSPGGSHPGRAQRAGRALAGLRPGLRISQG